MGYNSHSGVKIDIKNVYSVLFKGPFLFNGCSFECALKFTKMGQVQA